MAKLTLPLRPLSVLPTTMQAQMDLTLFTTKVAIAVAIVNVVPKFLHVIVLANSNPKIKTQTKQAEMLNQKSAMASGLSVLIMIKMKINTASLKPPSTTTTH